MTVLASFVKVHVTVGGSELPEFVQSFAFVSGSDTSASAGASAGTAAQVAASAGVDRYVSALDAGWSGMGEGSTTGSKTTVIVALNGSELPPVSTGFIFNPGAGLVATLRTRALAAADTAARAGVLAYKWS